MIRIAVIAALMAASPAAADPDDALSPVRPLAIDKHPPIVPPKTVAPTAAAPMCDFEHQCYPDGQQAAPEAEVEPEDGDMPPGLPEPSYEPPAAAHVDPFCFGVERRLFRSPAEVAAAHARCDVATADSAQWPQPFPPGPGGSCANGWFRSGSFCVPHAGAQDAIPLPPSGSCPWGWMRSGGFCLR